jgi:hypothetical protein
MLLTFESAHIHLSSFFPGDEIASAVFVVTVDGMKIEAQATTTDGRRTDVRSTTMDGRTLNGAKGLVSKFYAMRRPSSVERATCSIDWARGVCNVSIFYTAPNGDKLRHDEHHTFPPSVRPSGNAGSSERADAAPSAPAALAADAAATDRAPGDEHKPGSRKAARKGPRKAGGEARKRAASK